MKNLIPKYFSKFIFLYSEVYHNDTITENWIINY